MTSHNGEEEVVTSQDGNEEVVTSQDGNEEVMTSQDGEEEVMTSHDGEEEAGLIAIRNILSGFQDIRHRCHCSMPCRRKVITLQSWRSDDKNDYGSTNGFAYYQVYSITIIHIM